MRDDSHAPPTESNGRVLAELGAELCGHAADLEFSLRLRPKAIEPSGRFACWLAGESESDFAPIARALRRLDAPETVRLAQQGSVCPVRQGIAVAPGEGGFRLYLHGRDRTGRDTYQAWRWGKGVVSRSAYEFHFLPETPEGVAPLDLIDVSLRPAVAMLLADERVQQMSGFWLRRAADGTLEQLDLIFPWHPRAGDLPGLLAIAEHFALPLDHPSDWRGLPIRHIAFALGRPAVTLYASAPLHEPWPQTEGALQRVVRQGANRLNRDIEQQFFERLPSRATAPPDGEMLDRFYGGTIATWQQILGAELHYHAGLFDTPDSDDAAMTRALRRAVTELYPFIPARGSLYDIGCGWGGPLAMWTRDLQCRGLGLTISRTQFRHVASLGLPARWGDAERTLPPGAFDCAIMLESFCHVADKARLLAVLRLFASRLVMRVNCQDGSPAARAFGGTMHMVSSGRLRELLLAAGWRVSHWRDRRPEALPSVRAWSRRLAAVAPTDDRHIETLREWCARVLQDPQAWGAHNPLIEVVCE
jgi:cyclopropane fatty-acyl-phospholipid synthase-like methyltransferase